MFVPLLVLKNAFRHKLRTSLTVVGIVVAITAFGLLRTIVDAWYAGAEATSSARLVSRNAISLVFPMPLTYAQKIRQVPGRDRRVLGQLVRRRLHHRAQFLSAVRHRRRDVPRHVSGIRAEAGGEEGLPGRPPRRGRRAQAGRPVWLEGGRPDSAARDDLSRDMDVHAAGHLRRRRRQDRRDAVLLPLAIPERDGEGAIPAGAATRSASTSSRSATLRRPPPFRRTSTPRSRIRSPRRSPRPRRPSSWDSWR